MFLLVSFFFAFCRRCLVCFFPSLYVNQGSRHQAKWIEYHTLYIVHTHCLCPVHTIPHPLHCTHSLSVSSKSIPHNTIYTVHTHCLCPVSPFHITPFTLYILSVSSTSISYHTFYTGHTVSVQYTPYHTIYTVHTHCLCPVSPFHITPFTFYTLTACVQ